MMKSSNAQSGEYRQEIKDAGSFSDLQWNSLVEKIGSAFSMTEERIESIRSNAVFKLVGAIPFLAKCDEPERTSLSHMGTFILAAQTATKSAFAHKFQDSADIFRRLERISYFNGGNPRITERGMRVLTLAMLNDHVHDAMEDRGNSRMNPINAGHWNTEEIVTKLKAEISESPCPDMDEILAPDRVPGYWAS